ncbi:MAG: response regulator transcription factor [Clostridia bacterium]|nr:response regulator transcription factor [Clostridia bacterium]
MKILIAEQDRDFSSAFSTLLGMEQHTVTTVYDGTQVITRLETNHTFDIAVVDEALPRINADKLLKPLFDRNIPVIVLTSEKLTASRLMDTALANAYLTLPFLPSDLTGTIERVMKRKNSTDILRFEDVYIKLSEYMLCGSIPLTDGEIELFADLISHKQVSGKHMEAYISALNSKLEKLNKNIRIKYLIDEGYRMVKIQNE